MIYFHFNIYFFCSVSFRCFYMICRCFCPTYKCQTLDGKTNRDEHETVTNNVVPIERLLTAMELQWADSHCSAALFFFSRSVIIAHLIFLWFYGKLIDSILPPHKERREKDRNEKKKRSNKPLHLIIQTLLPLKSGQSVQKCS